MNDQHIGFNSKDQISSHIEGIYRLKQEIKGKMIGQVMEFQYLGIGISSDYSMNKEVKEQTMKGDDISQYVRDVTSTNTLPCRFTS